MGTNHDVRPVADHIFHARAHQFDVVFTFSLVNIFTFLTEAELVQWCRGEISLTTTARLRWHREHLERLSIRHSHTLDGLRVDVAIGGGGGCVRVT